MMFEFSLVIEFIKNDILQRLHANLTFAPAYVYTHAIVGCVLSYLNVEYYHVKLIFKI